MVGDRRLGQLEGGSEVADADLPPAREAIIDSSRSRTGSPRALNTFASVSARSSASGAVSRVAAPPLKLVLIEGEPGQETRLDHLGVEVDSTEEVTAATTRLKDAGLATFEENDTSCCYALQDKVWVHGPGKEPWEVYVVKADAGRMGKSPALDGGTCCADAG